MSETRCAFREGGPGKNQCCLPTDHSGPHRTSGFYSPASLAPPRCEHNVLLTEPCDACLLAGYERAASLVPEGTPPRCSDPFVCKARGVCQHPKNCLTLAAPAVRPEGPEAPKERSFTNSGQKYVVSGYDPAARDTGGAPSEETLCGHEWDEATGFSCVRAAGHDGRHMYERAADGSRITSRDTIAALANLVARPHRCPAVDDDGYQCERPARHDGPHRAVVGARDEQGPIPERVWLTKVLADDQILVAFKDERKMAHFLDLFIPGDSIGPIECESFRAIAARLRALVGAG